MTQPTSSHQRLHDLDALRAAAMLSSADKAKRLEAATLLGQSAQASTKTLLIERLQTEADTGGVAAVERALAILDAFTEQDRSLTLAQVATRTGFYKSTILRLAASLEKKGYLIRLADGGWHCCLRQKRGQTDHHG